MGFIDALNQERQAAILAAEQLKAKQLVEEEVRRQAAVDKLESRNKRIEQAVQIRKESGVDILMAKFCTALSKEPSNGRVGDYHNDPESIVDEVSLKSISSWGDGETGGGETSWAISVESRSDGTIVFWGGQDLLSISQTTQKNKPFLSCLRRLLLGTDEKRNEFARASLSIPATMWRTNPAILEESLERIYKNPYIASYGSLPQPMYNAGNG